MDSNQLFIMWSWACKQLEIEENATKEEIKKAYRLKVKQFHPDASKSNLTSNQYIMVQKAYEYLSTHTRPENKIYNIQQYQRPAKVFGNDERLNRELKKQKEIEKSKRKAQNWVAKEHITEFKTENIKNKKEASLQTDEEILNRIRTILFAEHIRRQIEYDKAKKENERKTELYKAFMQHQILEEADKNNGNNKH